MEISQDFSDCKWSKGGQVDRRGGRRWEEAYGGGLYSCLLPCADAQMLQDFSWASRKEGLNLTPTSIQNRPEPEFELSVNTRGDLPQNPQLRLRLF